MDRKNLTGLLGCLAALFTWSMAGAATHVVPDDYLTLTEAVAAAAAGDEIFVTANGGTVCDGDYDEAARINGKDLSIRADPDFRICISGNGTNPTIHFDNADGSVLSGFAQISNAGAPAIRVRRSGVLLRDLGAIYSPAGFAIHGKSGARLEILDSYIAASDVGVRLERNARALVRGSMFASNVVAIGMIDDTRAGFFGSEFNHNFIVARLFGQANLAFRDNRCEENDNGMTLSGTSTATVKNDLWFKGGIENVGDGLLAFESAELSVSNNTIDDSQWGTVIGFYDASSGEVKDTLITNNFGSPLVCSSAGALSIEHDDTWNNGGGVDPACPPDPDPRTEDPLYTGDYFLTPTSGMVDSGSDMSGSVFPVGCYGTDSGGSADTGVIDRGFHHGC